MEQETAKNTQLFAPKIVGVWSPNPYGLKKVNVAIFFEADII